VRHSHFVKDGCTIVCDDHFAVCCRHLHSAAPIAVQLCGTIPGNTCRHVGQHLCLRQTQEVGSLSLPLAHHLVHTPRAQTCAHSICHCFGCLYVGLPHVLLLCVVPTEEGYMMFSVQNACLHQCMQLPMTLLAGWPLDLPEGLPSGCFWGSHAASGRAFHGR
jgi:hypothetical protein